MTRVIWMGAALGSLVLASGCTHKTSPLQPLIEHAIHSFKESKTDAEKLGYALAAANLTRPKGEGPVSAQFGSLESYPLEARDAVKFAMDSAAVIAEFEKNLTPEQMEKTWSGVTDSVFQKKKRFSSVGFPSTPCDTAHLMSTVNDLPEDSKKFLFTAVALEGWKLEKANWSRYLRNLKRTYQETQPKKDANPAALYDYWLNPETTTVTLAADQAGTPEAITKLVDRALELIHFDAGKFHSLSKELLSEYPECFFRKKNPLFPMSTSAIDYSHLNSFNPFSPESLLGR